MEIRNQSLIELKLDEAGRRKGLKSKHRALFGKCLF
jgi:hypothetical protein